METYNIQSNKKTSILKASDFEHYVDFFNENDCELYTQSISNELAWDFLKDNIPLFECPDKVLEMIYYFRWWTYRKHIKKTSDGYVITEFLPDVPWAGKHNTINLTACMHIMEGRWIRNPIFLDDYITFWYKKGGALRSYTCWLPHAILNRSFVTGNMALAIELLEDMIDDFNQWNEGLVYNGYQIGKRSCGLYNTTDDRDGGEVSIGGNGFRPLINSAMFGISDSISRIANIAGRSDIEEEFQQVANTIKRLVLDNLWDPDMKFFMILKDDLKTKSDVRELYGYSPWLFHLPDPGYEYAWKEVLDSYGFYAPYGLTFAEQRHSGFNLSYEGHECQWNGPSWPLSTSIVLSAMTNLLNDYNQNVVSKRNFFDLVLNYARTHFRVSCDGKIIPWIDENLHPYTGDWISRTRLEKWEDGTWSKEKGGRERGKDYNHSCFCDLIISGLVGIRPSADSEIQINPLIPEKAWDWFCLDNILYHGKDLTVLWDKNGTKYSKGKGFHIFIDGVRAASSTTLSKISFKLHE